VCARTYLTYNQVLAKWAWPNKVKLGVHWISSECYFCLVVKTSYEKKEGNFVALPLKELWMCPWWLLELSWDMKN
jgi:hypothetical protein